MKAAKLFLLDSREVQERVSPKQLNCLQEWHHISHCFFCDEFVYSAGGREGNRVNRGL